MLRCASVSGAPTYIQYAYAPETSRALPDGFIRSRRSCFQKGSAFDTFKKSSKKRTFYEFNNVSFGLETLSRTSSTPNLTSLAHTILSHFYKAAQKT
jgi:hypothetical protein